MPRDRCPEFVARTRFKEWLGTNKYLNSSDHKPIYPLSGGTLVFCAKMTHHADLREVDNGFTLLGYPKLEPFAENAAVC